MKHKDMMTVRLSLSRIFFLAALCGCLFIYTDKAYAADSTWTGANSSDWTDAGNWSGGVPTSAVDVIIPDATTTPNDPNLANGAVCLSMTINANGVLNGNGQTITVYGNWTNNGTYNHGSGTIKFTGSGGNTTFTPGSSVYGNIEEYKDGAWYWNDIIVSGTAEVSGNFVQTVGEMRSGQINLSGNYTIGANSGGGSYDADDPTIINMNSAVSDQQVIQGGSGIGAHIRVDKAGGTLTVSSDLVINSWTYIQGTVAGFDTYALTFGDDYNSIFVPGSLVYGNVGIDKPYDYYRDNLGVTGTANISGNFIHTDGEVYNGQLDIAGNYVIGAAAQGTGETVTSTIINMNGASDQTLVYSAGGIGAQVRVDKPSGSLVINSDITLVGWTYVQGTVSGLDTYTMTFGDDSNGSFTPGNLVYNNLALNKTSGYTNFDLLWVNDTATVSGNFVHTDGEMMNGQFDLAGNYAIGSLASGTQVSNDYVATIINLNHASNDQQISCSSGGVGANVRIDKAGGTLTVSSDVAVNSWNYIRGTVGGMTTHTLTFGDDMSGTFTPGNLTYGNIVMNKVHDFTNFEHLFISAGTLNAASFTITHGQVHFDDNNPTVNISGSVIINSGGIWDAGSNTISVGGSWTNSGTFNNGSNLIIFNGNSNGTFTPGSSTYNDIQINKTASDWDFDHVTVSGTATVAGNLTHTDGRMLGGQMNLAGNYTINPTAGDGWYGQTATTINFNHASNNQSIVYNGGYGAQIRVDKAAGNLTVSSDIIVSGWSYIQGTVVGLTTYKLTLGGSATGNFVPGNLVYGNVEINKLSSDWDYHRVVVTGTGTISGNLIHTKGRMNGGQLNMGGDYIIAATASDGWYSSVGTIINFNDTDDQSIQYSAGGIGAQIRVDKSSGTLTIGSDISLGGWIYIQGTVNTLSSRTLTLAGGSDGSFTPGNLTYGNIVVNKSHFDTDYDDLTVGAGTLNVTGDLTLTDGQVFFSTNNTTVNVGGSISIAAAAFMNAGSNTITVSGQWTNSGTFSHGSGKIVFTGTSVLNAVFTPGSSTYNNIEINKTNHSGAYDNLSISGTATLAGNLIHTEGEFVNGQFDLTSGNYIVPATADGTQGGYTTTIVNFTGTGNQTITYSAGGIGVNIRIDKPSGTFSVPSDMVICSWTYIQGTVTGLDSYTLIFGDDNHGVLTPGNLVYSEIELNKPYTFDDFSVSGTATVSGDFIHTDGDFNGGQINLTAGDYVIGASAAGVSRNSGVTPTIMNFNGSGDQSIIYAAGGVGTSIRIDKPSGNLIVSDDIEVNGWDYIRGTVSGLDAHTLILGDDKYGSFTPGSMTYGDIEVKKTDHNGSFDDLNVAAGTINIIGDFTLTEGQVRFDYNNPTINLTGSLSIGASQATFTRGTSPITFIGTAPSTFTDSSASPQNVGKIVINKTNATSSQNKLTLSSDMLCDTMTISADNILDLGAYTLTLGNSGNSADVLTATGSLAGTGKVKYSATNSAGNINVAPSTYHDLELSGAETYALSGTTSISGNLTAGATSLLSPGTSSVILTGADQSLSGNLSFYNLTKDITSGDTLAFAASSSVSIASGGTLTLKGEDRSNRLSLRSSSEDTPWNLNVDAGASYDFDYLDVQDSTASRALSVLNSLDSGGNTNWTIVNNTAANIAIPSITVNGNTVTIRTNISDIDQDNISLKLEYSIDEGSTWHDPYLQSVTASSGAPILNNAGEYQLSSISTVSDNTIDILWDTREIRNELGSILEENIKIKITPFDGTDIGVARESLSFLVNNRGAVTFFPSKPDLSDMQISVTNNILSFTLLPSNVTEIAVSSTSDFNDASYQNISLAIDLSEYVSDIVYLKFRTDQGATSEVITYSRTSGIDSNLKDGDIVKTKDNFDVYIIKYKNGKSFKRLILSPSVFNSYQHLRWSDLKIISQTEMDKHVTSNLVKETKDITIYELYPNGDTGERRKLDTGRPYDADSVYEINAVDRDSYIMVK